MASVKWTRIYAIILLMLFMGYQASISLFYHKHIINGHTFTHSHPFAGGSHEHSAGQLEALSAITTFHAEEGSSLSNANFSPVYQPVFFLEYCQSVQQIAKGVVSLRAPPAATYLL